MSIRLRITIVAALLTVFATVVAAVVLVITFRSSLIEAADTSSRSRARELVVAASSGLLTETIANVTEEGVAQVVTDADVVLAASPNVKGEARLSDVVPDGGRPVRLILRDVRDEDEREDYRVWAVRGSGVTAYVGTSLDDENEVVFDLSRSLAIGLPPLVALFVAGVWVMVGRTLRPVEDIRAEVASISHRRLDRRVPTPPTNDEIGRLAETMNEMLGRLEEASQRQRDFVGNASHELQSPLASFRTQLEVASAHPEGTDWPGLARSLLADGNRMEGLVQDLLFLAREDAAEAARPTAPVDLDDVVLEEVSRMRSICAAEIHTDGVSAAPLPGHRDDLARLIRNLLDNACAYAASRIDVTLQTIDSRVELTVSDDGPGVAEEDKPRIFERFYRADQVRSPQAGGTGLGLAIVAAVAEAHGGTVEVTDADPGARFVVTLPTLA